MSTLGSTARRAIATFGSPYGGARVLMMDGMVRTLTDRTPPATLRALLTIDGGEATPGWDEIR